MTRSKAFDRSIATRTVRAQGRVRVRLYIICVLLTVTVLCILMPGYCMAGFGQCGKVENREVSSIIPTKGQGDFGRFDCNLVGRLALLD